MPTTLHKILTHGPTIIPIEKLSEELSEARNKDIKKYREGFARKCLRISNLEDVFKMLLVSSDPYITSLRQLSTRCIKSVLTRSATDVSGPYRLLENKRKPMLQSGRPEEKGEEEEEDNETDHDEK